MSGILLWCLPYRPPPTNALRRHAFPPPPSSCPCWCSTSSTASCRARSRRCCPISGRNQAADATFLSAHARITGYGFGFDAMGISLLSIPLVGAAVLAAVLTTRVAARVGGFQRATTLGFVLVGLGYALVAGYHGAVWIFVVSHLISGFGGGLVVAAMPVMVAEATRPERTGVAIGLYTNSRAIGGAVGAAAAASVLSAIHLPGIATAHARQPLPSEHAYVVLWAIIAVITFLGAGIAASTRRTE
ncbi:MFS transporter [Nocardia sp. NPDC020380]|uniref:MFS transporter n=1 Tax=Nocardia sp. NPDC020380 TaxID=3364309 RepID=UPI0037A9B97C